MSSTSSTGLDDPASWCAEIDAIGGARVQEESVHRFMDAYLPAAQKAEQVKPGAATECGPIGKSLLAAFVTYPNALALMRIGRCFQKAGDEVSANRWFSRAVAVAGVSGGKVAAPWSRRITETMVIPEPAPRVTPGHGDDVIALALDPLGRLMAVGGYSGDLRIWTRSDRTGWEQRWVLSDEASPVEQLAFTSIAPKVGGWLVSAHANGDVNVWEPRIGSRVWQIGRPARVTGLAVTPDARSVVTLQDDGALRVWRINGDLLAAADADAWETRGLVMTPDASWLAASVRVRPSASVKDHWVLATWQIKTESAPLVAGRAKGGAQAKTRLVAGPRWDLPVDNTWTWLGQPAVSPGGHRLAVSDCRGQVYVFAFGGRSTTLASPLELGTRSDTCGISQPVAFLDDTTLLVASSEGIVHRWKLDPTPAKLAPLALADDLGPDLRTVKSLAVRRGEVFAGLGVAGIAHWKLPRTTSEPVLDGPGGTVRSVMFGAQRQLVVSRGDGRVMTWDLAAGKAPSQTAGQLGPPAGDSPPPATFTVLSPDGNRAATAYWNGTTRLWDVATGSARTLEGRHEVGGRGVGTYGLAFDAAARTLVAAGKSSKLLVWDDLDTPGAKPREIPTSNAETTTVAFLGETKSVVVGEGPCPHVHDLRSGTDRAFQCNPQLDKVDLFSIVTSKDGAKAIANRGQDVAVWNVASGAVEAVCSGHRGYVRGVALTGDGTLAASASYDRTVRVWKLDGTTCSPVKILGELDGDAMWVSFSHDGKLLAGATRTGSVYLWDTTTWEERGRLYGTKDHWFVIGRDGGGKLRIDGTEESASADVSWTFGAVTLSGYSQWSRFQSPGLLRGVVEPGSTR